MIRTSLLRAVMWVPVLCLAGKMSCVGFLLHPGIPMCSFFFILLRKRFHSCRNDTVWAQGQHNMCSVALPLIISALLSRCGGWVVDGFPLTRENWAAMIEPKLLPDFVLSLEDEEAPTDYLLTRFAQLRGLPDPATFKPTAKEKKEPAEGEEEEGDKGEEPEKVCAVYYCSYIACLHWYSTYINTHVLCIFIICVHVYKIMSIIKMHMLAASSQFILLFYRRQYNNVSMIL